jgi:hypothetical protein
MMHQDQLIDLEGEGEYEPAHKRSAQNVISNYDSDKEEAKDEMSREGLFGN